MTDGRPGYASNKGYDDTYGWRYDNWNCMVANNAVNYASKIKENAVMYTVGVGEDLNKSFYWNAKHSSDSDWYDAHPLGHGKDDYIKGTAFLEKLATQPKSADQKYAYNTDDLDKQIAELWNNQTLTEELGEKAFKKLKKHYDSEVVYKQWETLFSKLKNS